MTTISPNRRKFQNRSRFFVLIGILILVIGAAALLRSPLASTFWLLAEPISKFQTASTASLGIFFTSFSSNRTLALQNAELRADLASAATLLMDRNILAAENADLKARLGRPFINVPHTLATVIARPPGVPYDTLMIDLGESAGMHVGDLVSAGGSVYIGSITEIYASASRVTLFSSPGQNYEAQLLRAGTSTLALSVKGQGGGSLVAEVPAGTSIKVGDDIFFSSISPQLVARVSYIEEKSETSFKKIFMQLPVNVYTLRFVEVYHLPQ